MNPKDEQRPAAPAGEELFGHPRGLTVLFTTEMWERFSYYGMASLLVLYLVNYLLLPGNVEQVIGYQAIKGGLERIFGPLAPQPLASQIYGFYAGFAYLLPILGGFLADRVFGQRRMAILGALLMAAGHFMMMFEPLLFFALGMLVLGMGAFKPNVSTQVGSLYAPEDARRVRAYSIYYFGINIGAFLAPLVAGTLGGEVGWHYGFGAAGIGMLISLAIYLAGLRHLPPDEVRHTKVAVTDATPFTARERLRDRWLACRVRAHRVLLGDLRAARQHPDALGRRPHRAAHRPWHLAGRDSDHVVSRAESADDLHLHADPAPPLGRAGTHRNRDVDHRQARARVPLRRSCEPRDGGAAMTLGPGEKASPLWLVAYFAIVTIGELHLGPVGLALVSRLAPARVLSLMMGLWLAASFPGEILGGWLGGFWSRIEKPQFFMMIGAIAIVAGLAVYALKPLVQSVFDDPEKP